MFERLYVPISDNQWPIVYDDNYNIKFFGLEKLHPFDTSRWANVFNILRDNRIVTYDSIVRPLEPTETELEFAHSKKYLKKLKSSCIMAGIFEMPFFVAATREVLQRRILQPMRLQTGGTIAASNLALQRGWSINIGGGFHHCSANRGGGFCAYADISFAINLLFENYPERVQRVLIVDLDAHQGNGPEVDFTNKREKVFILDIYNAYIYPHDQTAKRGISLAVELQSWTNDYKYLEMLRSNLNLAFSKFHPDFVLYNAGTDIMQGDPLGCLEVSGAGVIKRDEIVFAKCHEENVPICMVTSGGYQRSTSRVIADSICNLLEKGLIGPHTRWQPRPVAGIAALRPQYDNIMMMEQSHSRVRQQFLPQPQPQPQPQAQMQMQMQLQLQPLPQSQPQPQLQSQQMMMTIDVERSMQSGSRPEMKAV